MSDYLSREIRAEMEAARKQALKKRTRMTITAGEETYPVLRMLPDGFTLDAEEVDHLRGIVDLYDGARHRWQCLIIASEIVDGELICTMKWHTAASDRPALDYVREDDAPVGYLTHH
ncbi:MAG: hypothetical protein R3D56_17210 [Paracoccaceae bacterium]|jgi:hypothetical protein